MSFTATSKEISWIAMEQDSDSRDSGITVGREEVSNSSQDSIVNEWHTKLSSSPRVSFEQSKVIILHRLLYCSQFRFPNYLWT